MAVTITSMCDHELIRTMLLAPGDWAEHDAYSQLSLKKKKNVTYKIYVDKQYVLVAAVLVHISAASFPACS